MAQVKKIKLPNDPAISRQNYSADLQDQVDELRRLLEENLRYTKNTNQSVVSGSQVGLEKLLEENLKISKELLEHSKKIRRWVAWQRTWGVFKILIIVVPIILGIIYLPPLLQDLVAPFRELLNFGQATENNDSSLLNNATE